MILSTSIPIINLLMLYCSDKTNYIIEDDKIKAIVNVKNDFIKKTNKCAIWYSCCTLYVLIVVILAEQGFDKQC